MAATVRQVVGIDGKGGVIRIIADAVAKTVMSEFIGTGFEVINERVGGTQIHSRLERLIREEFGVSKKYGGYWLHIIPEVFFDSDGQATGRRARGSLGVDILFYINQNENVRMIHDRDAKVIVDFKTGRGWSNRHMDRLQGRFRNATIIQMFVPIIYRR